MMKFLKKIKKALSIYSKLTNLSDRQRTSLYRMLYWKTHYSEVPMNEYFKLIEDGWLIQTDTIGSYTWSDEANNMSNLFNGL